ncbi:MAG: NupC/NupG family nucleoside CNT transporter [Acidobacteriota bacterium]
MRKLTKTCSAALLLAALILVQSAVVFAQAAPPTVAPEPTAPSTVAPEPARPLHQLVRDTPSPLANRLLGFVGLALLLGIAYLASNDRAAIRWRVVAWGIALQVVFALFILRTRLGFAIFNKIGKGVAELLAFSNEGAKFVFGRLADPVYIETISRTLPDPVGFVNQYGMVFAFRILPTIIFVASLFAILYYLGAMQRIVYVMAVVMQRTMHTSGAESLSNAANVFMGQTEAPLVIAPFIKTMTMSELLTIMIGGMATVSGGVLAAYIGLGIDPVFLLTGSVMAAPASLMMGKMLYPEKETAETAGLVKINMEKTDANLIDAASRGAGEGMQLAINVAAMLIAFIAMIALVNALLSWMGGATGLNARLGQPFSLSLIFGSLFAPLAFLMGVPWADAARVGDLLGTKLVLNEFVAYLKLSPVGGNVSALLQPRSELIATYALCGFANFSSIGIQIGGIGGLAPNRRSDLARLGMRALLGGFLATCLTATLAGIIS